MARYLIDGVVYYDIAGTQPVPASDPYYYNADADEARQLAEQQATADAELARRQAANAAAWSSTPPQALPYPDAGFPPGFSDPYGGYAPGTQPKPTTTRPATTTKPAVSYADVFGGIPTWMWVVGAAAVAASMFPMRKR